VIEDFDIFYGSEHLVGLGLLTVEV